MSAPGVSSAVERSRLRRLSLPRELDFDEEAGELNVVPFLDVIVNILIFVLATIAVTFTGAIDIRAPSLLGRGVLEQGLDLTVIVVGDGIALKTTAGNVAPGCQGAGPGVAVPKHGGAHDFAALTACATRIKQSSAQAAEETQVFVTANPDVDYQTIVGVVDALRMTSAGEPLFPDVSFKVPR
jgi:biopolymer transport protein TolR